MDSHSPKANRAAWWITGALIVLSAVPVLAGAVRLGAVTGGADKTSENARFVEAPVPIALHVCGASLFCVLGALQLNPTFRRRRPAWHRAAGKLLVVCGLTAGLSGLWMTQFYPRVEGDGPALYGLRLLFGSAMVVCLILSVDAIRRRDFAQHGAWMTRAYAIALGAGTQVLVHLPWLLTGGKPGEQGRALLLGAAWVINVAVAEWSLRRRWARKTVSTWHRGTMPV